MDKEYPKSKFSEKLPDKPLKLMKRELGQIKY